MNKILLPELGEGITNVEIRDVLVKEGDSIKRDQIVLILETDKASMEIPSEHDGIVSKVYVKNGDNISPNDHIMDIQSDNPENHSKQVDNTIEKSEEVIKKSETSFEEPVIKEPLKTDATEIEDTISD